MSHVTGTFLFSVFVSLSHQKSFYRIVGFDQKYFISCYGFGFGDVGDYGYEWDVWDVWDLLYFMTQDATKVFSFFFFSIVS